MSIATSKRFTDKTGERQERTTWHKVTAWDKLAEMCVSSLQKGQLVYVDGEMLLEKFQAADGTPREKTIIKADQVVGMQGGAEDRTQQPREREAPARVVTRDAGFDDDEMPF